MASNKTNQLSRKLKHRSNPCTTPDVFTPITELANNLKSLSTFSNDTPKRQSSFRAPLNQNKTNCTFESITPENHKQLSDFSNVFLSAECLDFGSPLAVVKPQVKGIGQLVGSPLATPNTSRTRCTEVGKSYNCARGLFREPSDSKKPSKVQNKRAEWCRSPSDTPKQEPKQKKAFSLRTRTTKKSLFKAEKVSRCYSESEATNIMKAVELGTDNPDLIGDFTRPYALPMTAGKHQDLKSISAQTMTRVLNKEFISRIKKHVVIDCRFPYEYEGGHIRGAVNIYSKDELEEQFFQKLQTIDVLIFHCEFSSERGPSMCRFLRSKDREANEYPNLFYPEIYVLNGGYKAFFEYSKELCVPQSYKPMVHGDHEQDLKVFRTKSKNWDKDEKISKLTQFHGLK